MSRPRHAGPLTLPGLLLAAVAAAALVEGIFRADLAGLFWGAGFLLVVAYFLAAGLVIRARLSRAHRRRPGFLRISLPPVVQAPGEEASAHLRIEIPRLLLPGLTTRLALPLSWNAHGMDCVQARLRPGRNETAIAFRPPRRGIYRSRAAVLEEADVLGLTSWRLPVPLEESLAVLPAVPARDAPRHQPTAGGDSASRLRRRRRSEELLEVRKYTPGDDPRRLNWKVFAHLDQLFLRIGEETPPPDSHMLVVLDSSRSPAVPRRFADLCLDRLVQACASAACALVARRFSLSLSCQGLAGCPSFTEGSRQDLLLALAGVDWAGPGWQPEVPGGRGVRTALVFSFPGSPALRGIMKSAAARGWAVSLFLQGLPAEASPHPLSLRRLLVTEAPGPAPGARTARAPRRQATGYAQALAVELAEYRSPAWKVRHAEQA
jgi:uncharacterized protein (DUF58 family)